MGHLDDIVLLTLYYTILTFNDPKKKRFGNIMGKGENAGYQNFLFFPQCFLPIRSVFKRLALQTRKNQGLFGKGLNLGLCGKE